MWKLDPTKAVSYMTDISLWSLFVAQQDCRVTEAGYDYRGDVSITRTGVPCENDTLCRNSADTPGRERPWWLY